MKKIVKSLFILAILYLTFYVGLRLVGNQGLMIDRFAMNPNEFSWIDKTGVWIVVITPFILGVVGLILVGLQMYFPNRSYSFFKKCFTFLLVFSTILCAVIAAKVYNDQKEYVRVIKCIGDKISLDELKSIENESDERLLYITRTGCIECSDVTSELYHVLFETGVNLSHYDTVSDRVERAEELRYVLDKYSITQVPTLLIFNDGLIVDHYEGGDIINGIIKYAETQP